MSKVVALNPKAVTPELVVHEISTQIDTIKSIFCVSLEKDGSYKAWMAGEPYELSYASDILKELAHAYLRGEFSDSESE